MASAEGHMGIALQNAMSASRTPRDLPCEGAGPADQAALVRALADPSFYPHRPPRVEHVQTHISHVFLAGPYVYKLKKAVRFPFLDASTTARRGSLCEEELRLNWRLAVPIYLGVLPVTRERDGRLALGGNGTVVDRVVWMRRLPAERMLDRLVEDGAADAGMLGRLARLLADFHARAPDGPAVAAHAAPEAVLGAWRQVLALAAPLVGGALPVATHTILASFGQAFLAQHDALLRRRHAAGHRIREGHGDLRAEHVCIIDAPVPAAPPHAPIAPGIYVVDCVEFSHALRCNDVASEVAFLTMDLERLGRPDLAGAFVDAYVAASGDRELRTLLPFYCVYRACVRGAVEGLKAAEPEVESGDRLAAASTRPAVLRAGPALCLAGAGSGRDRVLRPQRQRQERPRRSARRGDRIRAPQQRPDTQAAARRAAALRLTVPAFTPRRRARPSMPASATKRRKRSRPDAASSPMPRFIRRADRHAIAAAAARRGRPALFLDCQADPETIRATAGRAIGRSVGCALDHIPRTTRGA